MIHLSRGPGLRPAAFVLVVAAALDLRAEGGDRLFCASGFRESGPIVELVHITVVVPEGADQERIGNEALAREGARPLSAGARFPEFVLSGNKWPQFFPGATGDRLVVQQYNPAGETLSASADASLAAAAQTWTDVPTSSFALALGERTSATYGFDRLNVVAWPATRTFSGGALASTVTTFDRTTGDIYDADLLINPGMPFALDPRPGDGTFDFQRVILHENGHVAGLGHSLDPGAVMFATLGTGPQSHELAPDDVDAVSKLYPVHFRAMAPPQPWVSPRRR